jgi:hypothetical protein
MAKRKAAIASDGEDVDELINSPSDEDKPNLKVKDSQVCRCIYLRQLVKGS